MWYQTKYSNILLKIVFNRNRFIQFFDESKDCLYEEKCKKYIFHIELKYNSIRIVQ